MSESPPRSETADVPSDVDETELHRLLADDRRRIAIEVLREQRDAVDLAHLAAAVARRADADVSPGTVSVRLHHVHLPMLVERGLASYDAAAATVEPHPALFELST